MELDATGIEGQNQKVLEIQTKYKTLMDNVKAALNGDASTSKPSLALFIKASNFV